MVERRRPMKVDEAIKKVMAYATIGDVQHVAIEESYGRFLGEDLIADHHVPPFDRSPYDGFALRSKDTVKATRKDPIQFEVIGEIGAGSVFTGPIDEKQVVRIMTGAQIPTDCDAVVMFEMVQETKVEGKQMITLKRAIKNGENISFAGEDTKKGTVLATKGTYISPGIIALLATFGYKNVPISVKPTIGIIATGSELLAVDEPLQPGKIRNSNAYMIYSQIERAGAHPIYLGQFDDDFTTCYEQVSESLKKVDILITTGGVSVGDYDYLPAIYEKLSANVLFNKVGMRPGSVTTVAEKDGKLLFGLSGNPSACYVGFELFTRPIIRTYLHCSQPFLKKETAMLGADIAKTNPFDRFVRGHLSYEEGKLVATSIGLDQSNVVSSLATANILIVLPAGTRGYKQGMAVDVILLEDQEGTTSEQFFTARKKSIGIVEPLFEIVEEPIKVEQLKEKVTRSEAGAITTFVGIVREWTKGRRTVYLEYQAYVPMAVKMLTTIGEEIQEKWPTTQIAITHRIGHLDISDIAVAIAVSAPHRQAAYEANQYAIERIKQIVPIWKKEYWADGEKWIGDQLENVPYESGKPNLEADE